jgi:hypothetical protein
MSNPQPGIARSQIYGKTKAIKRNGVMSEMDAMTDQKERQL